MTSPETSEPNVPAAPQPPRPSGAIRLLWWCLMLTPFVGTLLIFLLPAVILLAVGAAFVVAVDSIADRHLTLPQRAIGLSMAVAIIPATILGIYGAGSLGVFDDALNGTERFLTVVGTVAWVVSLRAVKPRAWQIMKKSDWKP